MPAVSVIVPVYNTEKYLEECIRSLTEQTLFSLELIHGCFSQDSGKISCQGSRTHPGHHPEERRAGKGKKCRTCGCHGRICGIRGFG